MKVSVTLNDITSFGEAWTKIQDAVYGKHTTKIYRALRPFIELVDDFKKSQQNYIKENAEDGQKIEQYESSVDPEGIEISDELKVKLGVAKSQEWVDFQSWLQEEMTEVHEFTVVPILEEAQANKLKIAEIRVFDVLGLLVNPKEEDGGEEDE